MTDRHDRAQDAHLHGAPGDSVARVRRRVFDRIAQDCTGRHLTVRAGPDGWVPLLEGIRCKVLRDEGKVLSCLLLLAPGATLPTHRHRVDEECIVLNGELRIGDSLVVRAGDYHVGRAGVLHAPITTAGGALLFLHGAPRAASDFF